MTGAGSVASGVPEHTRLFRGWVLVDAVYSRGGSPPVAHLRLIRPAALSDCEHEQIVLPVSVSGRVHELIELPAAGVYLEWQGSGAGSVVPLESSIREVGRVERVLRMGRRVVDRMRRLTALQKRALCLTPLQVLRDLPGAYRTVSQFRRALDYPTWVRNIELPRPEDFPAIGAHIRSFATHPHFHLIVMADGRGGLSSTLASLSAQVYRNFTCTIVNTQADGVATAEPWRVIPNLGIGSHEICATQIPDLLRELNEEGLAPRAGDWVIRCVEGDRLAPHALYWVATEALKDEDVAVLYTDDDAMDAHGHREMPRFKPAWSLTHYLAIDFIGRAVAIRRCSALAVGGFGSDWVGHGAFALVLRIAAMQGVPAHPLVRHVPAVLFHLRTPYGAEDAQGNANALHSVSEHLGAMGCVGRVEEVRPGVRRVRFLRQERPSVSIIVPTRDAPEVLRTCIESVLSFTKYPDYEVLVVDNQSSDLQALSYLAALADAGPKVRVLRFSEPFNFSAINNFAAGVAYGDALCLLNNDTEVISPDWLDEMVGHLMQPLVGAVGAKLFYPDGRVQHGGDTVGPGGCANHLHSLIDRNASGYCNRAIVAQELSAVTAACLLTWRDLFNRLGGLDAKNLPVAFNDVDYCLRVREAGHKVVWTPHAELYHHESLTRGTDRSPNRQRRARREMDYMRRRWRNVIRNDPFYNPNLSYDRPDFSPNHAPHIDYPWLRKA